MKKSVDNWGLMIVLLAGFACITFWIMDRTTLRVVEITDIATIPAGDGDQTFLVEVSNLWSRQLELVDAESSCQCVSFDNVPLVIEAHCTSTMKFRVSELKRGANRRIPVRLIAVPPLEKECFFYLEVSDDFG